MTEPVGRLADSDVLAVIPARRGSKGLPGKNLRTLGGVSLLEHAIRFARACPAVDRVVVSTDSEEIAAAARLANADVPFLRPHELAGDDAAMWPVLVHALLEVDPNAQKYEFLLLADPTSPIRSTADVAAALNCLRSDPGADGIVSVADPPFNPVWQCVIEQEGYMAHLFSDGAAFVRRQDAPHVRYIDGSFYLWRTAFVRAGRESWFEGRTLMQLVNSFGAIDTLEELDRLEELVAAGLVMLPRYDGTR